MKGIAYVVFVTETHQTELAEMCRVSQQMVSSWLRGVKKISDKHTPILANYFCIDESYFNKDVTLEDKIEIELQLASKTGKYVSIDYQAAHLHKQNQAVKEKYTELLLAVEDYARTFEKIKEDVEGLHRDMAGLLQIEGLMENPVGCEKVYGILQSMQSLRKDVNK